MHTISGFTVTVTCKLTITCALFAELPYVDYFLSATFQVLSTYCPYLLVHNPSLFLEVWHCDTTPEYLTVIVQSKSDIKYDLLSVIMW